MSNETECRFVLLLPISQEQKNYPSQSGVVSVEARGVQEVLRDLVGDLNREKWEREKGEEGKR